MVAKPVKIASSTTVGIASSHFDSHSAAAASFSTNGWRGARCRTPTMIPTHAHQHHQQHPGHEAGDVELLHARPGHHRVEDDRQAGREEQPERAGRGDEAQAEALGVLLARSASGKTSPPSARMVTPEPPVKVVKPASTTTIMIARPPGAQPMSARASRRSRLEAPPSARM